MPEDPTNRACSLPPLALPHQRAFLVQLAVDAVPAAGALRGRAVHIRSGEAVPFENVAELLRFLDVQLASESQSLKGAKTP